MTKHGDSPRDGDEVYKAVEGQATALARPPMSLDELLDRLAVTMPSFVQALRTHGDHR